MEDEMPKWMLKITDIEALRSLYGHLPLVNQTESFEEYLEDFKSQGGVLKESAVFKVKCFDDVYSILHAGEAYNVTRMYTQEEEIYYDLTDKEGYEYKGMFAWRFVFVE